jgi:putative transcriptional regulator
MSTFGEELIKSAQEALQIAEGAVEPAFVHVPEKIDVAAIRKRKNMSQERFAKTFGLAPSAIRDWEQERRAPDRTARILLAVIDKNPEAVSSSLDAAPG